VTYSIVARDPATGAFGVAVQTYWFGVGSAVPWAQPGVGAVATQSFTEISYGPRGLEMMRAGSGAPETLAALLAADEGAEMRQVAMVDAEGNAAAHTGASCVDACGHVTGDGVSCQANMMERDTVWDAMMAAFAGAEGDLGARLLAALEAAEGEGGDIRGRQSAALVVVPGSGDPWERTIDIRVEDSDAPLEELARLLNLSRAWDALGSAGDHLSEERFDDARAAYEKALTLDPDDDQIAFWAGNFYAQMGEMERAKELHARALAANPRWAPYLRRITAIELFPNDPDLMNQLMPLD
jgi:uncharacterized Ntn-hydrolase superfamily protein